YGGKPVQLIHTRLVEAKLDFLEVRAAHARYAGDIDLPHLTIVRSSAMRGPMLVLGIPAGGLPIFLLSSASMWRRSARDIWVPRSSSRFAKRYHKRRC